MTTDNIIRARQNTNSNINNEYYHNYNLQVAINNMINNLNNHNIVNHPIDQIIYNKHPVGVPIVDGYVFCWFREDVPVVNGKFSNDYTRVPQETGIPCCEHVCVGRPLFRFPWRDEEICVGREI